MSATARATVRTYDFRRPDKFNKDQLRTIAAIHESAALSMAVRLSSRLRLPIDVTAASVEQALYGEHVEHLELPRQLAVIEADGLAAPALIDIDIRFCLAAVERLIGGTAMGEPEPRTPTGVESEIIRRVVEDLLEPLSTAWAQIETMNLRIGELAFTTALLRVAAPSSAAAIVRFTIRVGEQEYSMAICYPSEAIAPVAPKLSVTSWYADTTGGAAAGWRGRLEYAVGNAPVEVRATLGRAAIPVSEIIAIAPGDVIRLDQPSTGPILLTAANAAAARAVPGRSGERLAVRLIEGFRPQEEQR